MMLRSAAAALAAATVLIGCQSSGTAPTIAESAPYDGPPITLTESSGSHVGSVEAPSPGWQISRDRILEAKGHTRIFVSLTEPDPRFSYAQVIVTQNILTNVDADKPIRVFARVLPGGDSKVKDAAYRPVPTASTVR